MLKSLCSKCKLLMFIPVRFIFGKYVHIILLFTLTVADMMNSSFQINA